MNVWYLTSGALLILLLPAVYLVARGPVIERLIGLEFGTGIAVVMLLTLEQGMERQSFFDLSLALAVLTFPSTLLFARFYRRWL